MRKVVHLTWEDFDQAVWRLAGQLEPFRSQLTGVYGEPRGGLPLAVALSHQLKLPFIRYAPWQEGASYPTLLWCDDIVDSGLTLQSRSKRIGRGAVWVRRAGMEIPAHVCTAHVTFVDAWMVFPWERRPSQKEVEEELERLRLRGP